MDLIQNDVWELYFQYDDVFCFLMKRLTSKAFIEMKNHSLEDDDGSAYLLIICFAADELCLNSDLIHKKSFKKILGG